MRMLVMFDLPMDTPKERRSYTKFRKALIKNGFQMLQKSVYTRLIITPSVEGIALAALRKEKPENGVVMVLTVTEKQFAGMQYLVGEYHSEVLDSDERLVIL